jgi:hypothetical protein
MSRGDAITGWKRRGGPKGALTGVGVVGWVLQLTVCQLHALVPAPVRAATTSKGSATETMRSDFHKIH